MKWINRILLTFLLLSPLTALGQTDGFNGFCTTGNVKVTTSGLTSTTTVQQSYPKCTVTVYLTGTLTKATIFKDALGTALGNPFTANTDGSWLFFAADNQGFDVTMSGGVAPNVFAIPFTLTDLKVGSGGGTTAGCQGTLPGDNTSTNCGFGNLVANTTTPPANTSSFGYSSIDTNASTNIVAVGNTNANNISTFSGDVVAIGDNNAHYLTGAGTDVAVGYINFVGTVSNPCRLFNVVAVGQQNINPCPQGTAGANTGDIVAVGDNNFSFNGVTEPSYRLGNVVAVGDNNFIPATTSNAIGAIDTLCMGNNSCANIRATLNTDLVGIGDASLTGYAGNSSNTTPWNDIVAIGDASGINLPNTAGFIVGIGLSSAVGCQSGNSSCTPGSATMQYIVGIGESSGVNLQGTDVVAIGDSAMTGFFALSNPTPFTGHDAIAIGNHACTSLTTGTDNICIGDYAGSIGYDGVSTNGNANKTGIRNVWIGDTAGPNTTSQLNNTIAIGYQAYVTASNQITLGNSSNTLTIPGLAGVGTYCLKVDTSGNVTNTGAACATASSPLTTKGDIWVYSSVDTRLPVGTNGQVLSANSAQTTGLQWISALTNPMTTLGDIIYGGAAGAATRLAGNTTASTLCLVQTGTGSISAAPSWSSCAGSTSTALSSVSAASTNATIANGNNPIVWNWAQTTNSQTAFTFGETSAATGTSDIELAVTTATGSTAIPVVITESLNSAQTIPALEVLPTWNTTGVVDAAILVNATNTASGAASKLLDLQVGGSSKFSVDKSGNVLQAGTLNSTSVGGITVSGTPSANQVLTATSSSAANWQAPPVTSVSNSDSTLTISPTTGAVVASINLAHGNTWSATQTFNSVTLSSITGSTQCLQVNASGAVSGTGAVCGSGGGGATAWSSLTNPTTALTLSMAANSSTFTYNAATGAGDLYKLTDTTGNTGTGRILRVTTASGSTENPFQADANGVGWQVTSSGTLQTVGFTGAGELVLGEGSAPAGSAGNDLIWGDATTHRLRLNPNNAGAVSLGGIATAGSAGDSIVLTANGVDYVDSKTATVFAASGDTSCATDSAALQAGITAAQTSGIPMQLQPGIFYADNLSVTGPIVFRGSGGHATIIKNCSTTNNVFTLAYHTSAGGDPSQSEAIFSDFDVTMKSGVNPTAGYGFQISNGGTGYLSGLHLQAVSMSGIWQPFLLGTGVITNWIKDLSTINCVSNIGIEYNTVSPGGDYWISDLNLQNCSLQIDQADTTTFNNLKINVPASGTAVKFTQAGFTSRVRFINPSIESTSTACYDFGTGSNSPSQVQIVGGGCGLGAGAMFANVGNAVLLQYITNDYTTADGNPGPVASGWLWPTINATSLVLSSTTLASSSITNSDAAGTGTVGYSLSDDNINGSFQGFGPNFILDPTLKSKIAFGPNNTTANGLVLFGTSGAVSGNTNTIDFRPGGYAGAARTLILDKNQIEQLAITNMLSQTVVSSATTIAPTSQAFHVSGTTTIQTITAPTACITAGQMCQITIIPDGIFATNTSGNIALATAATVVGKALIMTYDPGTSKWYPSY